MGNQALGGGLLSGLAHGIEAGGMLQYRQELMKIQRDELSNKIKDTELKRELAEKKAAYQQQVLGMIGPLYQGIAQQMAQAQQPLGAGVMPPADPATELATQATPGTPPPAFAWQAQSHLKPHQALIEKYALENGIQPARLAGMIDVESAGDPNAVSSAGARGLMQLMPDTGKAFGLTDANAFDPEANIAAGSKLYGHLLKKYQGNEAMALAAYYRGETFVDKQGGVPADQTTMAYLQKQHQRMPFQRPAAVAAQAGTPPTGPAGAQPGRPPRAPITYMPNVKIDQDGDITLSLEGTQQKYEHELRETRLPNGNTQMIQVWSDPVSGQSWKFPYGAEAPPEAVIESQRQATDMGFPPGTQIHMSASTRYRQIQGLPPAEQSIALDRLRQEGSDFKAKFGQKGAAPTAGALVPGETVREQAMREDVQQAAKTKAATTQAQTANEPLPPVERKMLVGANRVIRAGEILEADFDPDFIGTPLQHYIGAHKAEFEKQGKSADNKKYSPGSFSGYVDGWIRSLKGTISPKQARFYKALGDFQDLILRERSGAAVSPGEAIAVKGFTVDAWNSPTEFKAGLNRVMSDVRQQREDIYQMAQESAVTGYERLKSTPAPTPTAPAAPAPTAKKAPAAAKDDKADAEKNAKGAMLVSGVEAGQLSPQVAIQGLMALGFPRNAAEGVVAEAIKKIKKPAQPAPATQGQTGQRGYFD